MGSSPNAGSEVSFAQFILDSHVFGRKLTEDEEREYVHATAQTLAALLKEVAPTDRAIKIEVLRSRGVRGSKSEAPLPSGNLWGIQLSLREVEVLPNS